MLFILFRGPEVTAHVVFEYELPVGLAEVVDWTLLTATVPKLVPKYSATLLLDRAVATVFLAAVAASSSAPGKAMVLVTLMDPSSTLVTVQLATTPWTRRMLASSVLVNCSNHTSP